MVTIPFAPRRLVARLLIIGVVVSVVVISRLLPAQRWLTQDALVMREALPGRVLRDVENSNASYQFQPLDSYFPNYASGQLPLVFAGVARFERCSVGVNPHTRHIRLPHALYNISMARSGSADDTRFFNPAILPLPHWSGTSKYVVVSRVVTTGFHQESHICLADVCLPFGGSPDAPRCQSPLEEDAGLRCTTTPIKINIPPTPAQNCTGAWLAFPDIPGFHDPRVFWSGKGEPLILVNSASRYGCVGLWVMDLRRLSPELDAVLSRGGGGGGNTHGLGVAVRSYPHLTEITRNPRSSRAAVEKNWVMFFPNRDEAYVQYDLLGSPTGHDDGKPPWLNATIGNNTRQKQKAHDPLKSGGRTFAKLTGNGFTTPNLTSPRERACFGAEHHVDHRGHRGHWHQGSNALRLILCTRAEARLDPRCGDDETAVEAGRAVHFAVMHRKFSNELDLPMRYERYVVVWESRAPFQLLAVSRWPVLMRTERARPWTEEENWPRGWNETAAKDHPPETPVGGLKAKLARGVGAEEGIEIDQGGNNTSQQSRAYFTYTPSLAWAWRPHSAGIHQDEDEDDDVEHLSQLGTGYLGDQVLVGIGMDDLGQAFARVPVDDLLQCMRLCPGVKLAHRD